MTEKIYLETLKSVLGRSVFHYSQLSFYSPYNQPSEESILELSLYYTKCLINGKLGGWVSKFRE